MESLASPRVVKEIIERHGFRFSKSLGQNFLVDKNILTKIIDGAGIDKRDVVLEVGPGIGTLTREMAALAEKVVAVEIDKNLLPILRETVGNLPNVHIIHGDILKTDLKATTQQYFGDKAFKVVANLPYYITTPIIMRFLEEGLPFETLVVMVQKEVAQRMNASPGTKDYGALSVAVQYYTSPRLIGKVPATVFMPPPKVDSMVIALDKRKQPPVTVTDKDMFFRVVKAAFASRRKTLLNNLVSGPFSRWDKEAVLNALEACRVDPGRRGETLTIKEFADIANVLAAR